MSQRVTQRATQHLTTTTTATTQTFFQRLILVHDDNAKASVSSSLTHPFRFRALAHTPAQRNLSRAAILSQKRL